MAAGYEHRTMDVVSFVYASSFQTITYVPGQDVLGFMVHPFKSGTEVPFSRATGPQLDFSFPYFGHFLLLVLGALLLKLSFGHCRSVV